MAADAAAKATTTANGTWRAKRRDGRVVSGGQLVAKTLKAEGVDVRYGRVAALAL
jgi:hypothetical protein